MAVGGELDQLARLIRVRVDGVAPPFPPLPNVSDQRPGFTMGWPFVLDIVP